MRLFLIRFLKFVLKELETDPLEEIRNAYHRYGGRWGNTENGQSNVINAIRLVRNKLNCSLKEAKDIVDGW